MVTDQGKPLDSRPSDSTSTRPVYERVLLKLSGESLIGGQSFGVEPAMMQEIAAEIQEVHQLGVEVAIVGGGGTIIRGVKVSDSGFDRAPGA